MITTKQKWITIGICFVLLMVCAAFGLFRETGGAAGEKIERPADMQGKTLGGVVAKMPDASAKIFFESVFGVKFGAYQSYETPGDAVLALQNNLVQGIWASDVAADYLVATNENLKIVGDYQETEARLWFAFAFRPEDTGLRDACNVLLADMKEDLSLDKLLDEYVYSVSENPARVEDMIVNSDTFSPQITGKTLYIGITGAVPPMETIGDDGNPYGFCVALSDRVGQALGRRVKFVVLDNETAFSELMAGKVELVFCYGTSENHSTEFPEYIMSDGYCPMYGYRMLVTE